MDDRSLDYLLRQTDAASPAPAIEGRQMIDGALGVLRRRRDRRRVAGVGLAAVAVVGSGLFFLWPRVRRQTTLVVEGPVAVKPVAAVSLAELDGEIRVETLAVDEMLSVERQEAAEARLARLRAEGDVHERMEAVREQAAVTLLKGSVGHVDRQEAVAVCWQVVRLFPETGAAVVARQELAEIQ